jgi:uncharacterized protein
MRATFVMIAAISIFAGALAGSTTATAQGIDCRRPPTAAEVTICRDPALMQLDERLSRHYFRLRGELRGRELYRFEEEQAGWRETRRRCIYNIRCLYSVYNRRIDELREYRRYLRDYRPEPREYRRF